MARLDRLFDRYRRKDDMRALAAVFDRTAPGLLRVALHLTPSPYEAEDLVQQTFVTAMERARSYDAGRPLRPWLAGILRNHAKESQRRRRRDTAVPLSDPVATTGNLDGVLDALSWNRDLAQAVESLGAPYRQPLVLRLQHGLAPGTIAEILDLPPATVRSHLHRGLAKLKSRPVGQRAQHLLAVVPALRGLDAIRGAVLASVHPGTAALSVGTAALPTLGGALMLPKISPWLAGLALSLLLLGVAIWFVSDDDGTSEGIDSSAAILGADEVTGDAELSVHGAARTPLQGKVAGSPIDLSRVDRDRDVHGVVVDEQGNGIAGAELSLGRFPWRNLDIWAGELSHKRVPGPTTLSAADGTFALRWTANRWGRLRVQAAGRPTIEYREVQAGERLRIVLSQPVGLVVTVRTEDGEPVPEAKVQVLRIKSSGWARRVLAADSAKATTDAMGRAQLSGLPASCTVVLRVTALAAALRKEEGVRVDLPATGEATANVTLQRARDIHGRVVDAATDAPIANAVVGVYWGNITGRTTTDASGAFVLRGWENKSWNTVVADAEGYARADQIVRKTGPVEIRLVRGFKVTGRVVGQEGRPLSNPQVAAIASGRAEERQRLSFGAVDGKADGTFEIDGLHPAMPHTLIVLASGHGRRLFDFDVPHAGSDVDLGDLALGAAHRVHGVVSRGDGIPAAGLRVELRGANDDRARLRSKDAGPAQDSYGEELSRRTDDLGRFRFPELSPGTYTLIVWTDAGQSVQKAVVVRSDQSQVRADVQLAATRRIEVSVVDSDDAPMTGVTVTTPSGIGMSQEVVDANGSVQFDAPEKQRTVFTASKTEGNVQFTGEGKADPGETSVRIVVRRMYLTSGLIVDPEGQPISGASIRALKEDGSVLRYMRADEDGRFSVAMPRHAITTLVFEGRTVNFAGGSVKNASVPFLGRLEGVAAGASNVRFETHVDTSLTSLTIVVLDAEGKGVPHVHVQLGPDRSASTGSAGRALAHNLKPEEIEVACSDPMVAGRPFLMPKPVRVTPAGQTLTLKARAGHMFRGRVVGPEGQTSWMWPVEAYVGGERIARSHTERDGRFLIVVEKEIERLDELRCRMKLGDVLHEAKAVHVEPGTLEQPLTLAPVPGAQR